MFYYDHITSALLTEVIIIIIIIICYSPMTE